MSPLRPDEDSKAKLELQVLRAVCQGTPQGSVRDGALRVLCNYAWREPVHQAIFGCLARLTSANLEFLRSELPACLTRKGFPDVDLELLFEPHSLTKEDAERLMRELKDS